jgi:hypothetical protein
MYAFNDGPYRQKMMPAMTSIAVTASICANASEAALLVASFTSNSLDLGMSHRCPQRPDNSVVLYSEHPTTSIRFDESPLSEHRPSQGRTAMRRHFDSGVLLSRQPPDRIPAELKSDKINNKCRKTKVNDGPY